MVKIKDIDFWQSKDYHKELAEKQIENIGRYDSGRKADRDEEPPKKY